MDWKSIDNSPKVLRSYLESRGLSPQKRWGQNFMVAPGARDAVVSALGPRPSDTVWEIGPGLGAITAMLVERCSEVVVFEIDHGIIRSLADRFGEAVRVVAGDAVKTLDEAAHESRLPDLIAGNLPYRSAAAIVAVLLESEWLVPSCRRAVFTVQREMARRMVAAPGTKDYSPFSVLCALRADVRHVSDLAGGSFYPVPEVVSSLVVCDPKPVDSELLRLSSLCSRSLFSSRRKTVRNNLGALAASLEVPVPDLGAALEAAGIDPAARAETIPPEGFLTLAELVRPVVGR